MSKCLFPQEQTGRSVKLTTHLYLSAQYTDNEHSYNSTPPYASRLTQGYRYVYFYYVVLRKKDMPYCFVAFTAQQYIPTADSTKHRTYVSRCDANEKDVEFRVIMTLLPYTLQPRPQQLKLEVKRIFAEHGGRPAKETHFSPSSGGFILPTYPSLLHQMSLS